MSKEPTLFFHFVKINYLPKLIWFSSNSTPKENFRKSFRLFFENNSNKKEVMYRYKGRNYQFTAVNIQTEYIWGKIYKLREKIDKDFEWERNDYVITKKRGDNHIYNYFLIDLSTNHIIIQNRLGYSSTYCLKLIKDWFEDNLKVKDAIEFEFLKSRKNLLKQLSDMKNVKYAKFTLYPSNFDWEELSKPVDDELHRLNISKRVTVNESNESLKINMSEKNTLSSELAQILRGNGEDPYIKGVNDKNKTVIIRSIDKITRALEDMNIQNYNSLRDELIELLKDAIDGQDKE